ncbi:UNVERIFIED_CONTAM: hypothetical protein Sangu_2528100 [Sesamum angustifolium]|uniref:Fructose-bisphosphate aldolase n=1 Tax=Sesamum angustifolium TaxID=2727405 RepID=A0AAW2JFN2_9LAMI
MYMASRIPNDARRSCQAWIPKGGAVCIELKLRWGRCMPSHNTGGSRNLLAKYKTITAA